MRWDQDDSMPADWLGEISREDEKLAAAKLLAPRLRDGDVVGIGSGSTAFLAVRVLAQEAQRQGIQFSIVPTSLEVGLEAARMGIPTTSLLHRRPNWSLDGTDEVDPNGDLLKGRGGAMLREKIVMRASPERYILVDRSKLVPSLGQRFPVPVEIVPEALRLVETDLAGLGATEVRLRLAKSKDGPVVTELGGLILDVRFREIHGGLEPEIKALPGVIESGLFQGYFPKIVVGDSR